MMGQGQHYSDSPAIPTQPQFHGSPTPTSEPSSLAEEPSANARASAQEPPDLTAHSERQPPHPSGPLVRTRSSTDAPLSLMPRIAADEPASSARVIAWAAQLEALFEATGDGLSVYDQEGHLIYANAAARQSFVFARWPDHSSLSLAERAALFHLRDATGALLAQERWPLFRLLHGERVAGTQAETVLLRTPDGRDLLLGISGTPLYDAADQIVGAVLISKVLQDMTAINEIEQLKRDLKAMKEAEQMKDNFIATAAHELRSPLTALMGYAEMLNQQATRSKGSELAEWQIEALETIAHDTMRIVGLTNDLLDVTRLQAGQLPLHRYNTNLVALVHRVVARLRDTTKRHTLVVESTAQRIVANLDVQRIEQVVSNLVNNAIKYSPNGGEVLLRIKEDGQTGLALLSVRDQGIGIPANQQAQIFNRFFRATNATRLGFEGSGLGLYLSRELIQLHDGQIWFESSEGQGSTFFLALPFSTAPIP